MPALMQRYKASHHATQCQRIAALAKNLRPRLPRSSHRLATAGIFLALLTLSAAPVARAQTFTVLHAFTGLGDGFQPYAGVTIDQAGNLYGTTTQYVRGTVFQMKHHNGAWILNTLYQFGYGEWAPQGRVVQGPGGALYGTTYRGGDSFCTEFGCGTVYGVRPPQTFCRSVSCFWSPSFVSLTQPTGFQPGYVDPAFDGAGNMYVTTIYGGANYVGNVDQLTRSGGQWTPTSVYDFSGLDGEYPYSGVTLDAQGNIYGTTWMGGPNNFGTVYRLTHSGSGWTLNTLYSFTNSSDGSLPVGGLVFDQAGNLYGTTESGGAGGAGTVFELSPSGGGWNFTVLHSFTGQYGPFATLTMDGAGNLYGTAFAPGAFGKGSVFKLTHNGGGWIFTDLHDFTGGDDGANPIGGVTLDAAGNLYGTTLSGGIAGDNCPFQVNVGCGVVWEITP